MGFVDFHKVCLMDFIGVCFFCRMKVRFGPTVLAEVLTTKIWLKSGHKVPSKVWWTIHQTYSFCLVVIIGKPMENHRKIWESMGK